MSDAATSQAADIPTVAPGMQDSMVGTLSSRGGTDMSKARAMLAAQRAEKAKALDASGKPLNPQKTNGNPSEAGRILAQQATQARAQRQAEAARQVQEAEALAATAVQQAANTPDAGTDGLETDDQLQSGADTAGQGDGQSDGGEDPDAFDQAVIDLGEGESMSRAEIKQHLMRQADYTQKTQALSADKAAFEADRSERLGLLDTLYQHLANQIGQPKSMKQWLAEDPIDGLAKFADQQERLEQLQTAQNVRAQERQHHIGQLRNSTLKALSEKHGDKAQGYFKDAVDYAHSHMGGNRDALEATLLHPFAIEALNKAKQWDALQASQKTVQRTVSGKPAVVKPGTRVSAQQGVQSAFQKSMAALKASGSRADARAALQAKRAMQRR